MKLNHLHWLAGSALSAMVIASPVLAQDKGNQSADPDTANTKPADDIIVTGSRIQRSGFDAPTPTTVLDDKTLSIGDRPGIAQALNDSPQFRPSITPETSVANTNSAATAADLRGLTPVRTLTLLNSHRFSGSNDLNSIPQNAVKRVDVVTGGASAAWGSGAVAGVVNIILDDDLVGLKAGVSSGVSSRGDGARYGADLAWGAKFAGSRGHILIATEYQKSEAASDRASRPNMNGGTFERADGQAVLARNVNYTIANNGGAILGLTGAPTNLVFNRDGSISPLQLGSETFGQLTIGGNGQNLTRNINVSSPYERINMLARASYDVTDSLKIWADFSFTQMKSSFGFFPDTALAVIMPDNAFLTAAARTQLAAAGVSGPFILGRLLDDVGPNKELYYSYNRRNLEGAIGFEGSFGNAWKYRGYYDHGELRNADSLDNQRIVANFNRAVDSVLVNGQPVCRVNTDPDPTKHDPSCVPLNLFGNGNISDAARAYSFGKAYGVNTSKLDTVGVSLSGQPFSTWAGPVDIAIGGDFRWEKLVTTGTDPLSLKLAFAPLSFVPTNGGFDVKEYFGEINVPLINLPGAVKLEVNGAARYSDYSTSGGIWSWKFGGTARLFGDLLLRSVYSRDIRSPSITEYYLGRATSLGPVFDPYRGNELVSQVYNYTGGNPNLQPEISHTLTIGGSYSPHFVPGLRLSVDYYKIKIDGVIVTLQPQDALNLCKSQFPNDNLCGGLIQRDTNGTLTSILRTMRNLAKYDTSGLDIEASYQQPLGAGTFSARVLATHVFELLIDDGVETTDRAGIVGGEVTFSTPKWRGTGTLSYDTSDWGGDLRVRYVDGGLYTNQVGRNGQLPLNNNVTSRTYLDLGVRLKAAAFTLTANINNLFDRKPPLSYYTAPNYDVIGRYFSMGAKLSF